MTISFGPNGDKLQMKIQSAEKKKHASNFYSKSYYYTNQMLSSQSLLKIFS